MAKGENSFKGKFADYLAEAGTPDPIELKIDGKKVLLQVPTKSQLIEFYEARDSTAEGVTPRERADAMWRALLQDDYDKVMAYFDDAEYSSWQAFTKFVDITWFGKGASDVEGN